MSEKLRVACYGISGHQILPSLKDHPRAEPVSVAEIPVEAVRECVGDEAAARVRMEPDLDAILSADDVDLVSLCSPRRDEQLDHAYRCLRAGKHVLAEKPAVITVAELDGLKDFMAGCDRLFWPLASCACEGMLLAIRDLVDGGRLGTVAQVLVRKSYPYHDGRSQDRGVDGGLIRQAGIHGVRYIQWATGQKAVAVSGFDTTCGNPKRGNLQMAASVSLQLDGGAVAQLTCNYLNQEGFGHWGDDAIRVSGTAGFAETLDGHTRSRMFLGDEPEQPVPGADRPFPDFVDCIVDHLLDGSPMPWSLEDDLHALRTVCRAQEAVDRRCVLEV